MSGWESNIVDLVAALAVLGSFLSALGRRRGLLAAFASAAGAALLCWVAAGAVLVWAPPAAQQAVTASRLVALVPPPIGALQQAGRILDHAYTTIKESEWT